HRGASDRVRAHERRRRSRFRSQKVVTAPPQGHVPAAEPFFYFSRGYNSSETTPQNSMSGHSHWAGIKHKKEITDQKRGKVFSKLLAAISAAAKTEPNPDFNPRLRTA